MVNGKYYIRGLTSYTLDFRTDLCNITASVVFTDVSYFSPWITETLKNFN